MRRAWRAPSEEEIENYRNVAYPRWQESVRESMHKLAARLADKHREVSFSIVIANDGFVNAEDVRLTITSYDGILLLDSPSQEEQQDLERSLPLPKPPDAPRGRYVSTIPGFSPAVLRDFMPIPVRDLISRPNHNPSGFYFVGGRPDPDAPTDELELTCDAFPHQGDPYCLGFRGIVPKKDELGRQPRLRIRLQAKNLRNPIEQFVRISVTFASGDFVDWVGRINRGDTSHQ
jgi:hypothetical protein